MIFDLQSLIFDPKQKPNPWRGKRMVLDGVALEQLSLVPLDYAAEETAGSLFGILNKCHTPFGELGCQVFSFNASYARSNGYRSV